MAATVVVLYEGKVPGDSVWSSPPLDDETPVVRPLIVLVALIAHKPLRMPTHQNKNSCFWPVGDTN